MGLELSILGIRKIKDEEIKELTGKTRKEMEKSKFSESISRKLHMIHGIGVILRKRFQSIVFMDRRYNLAIPLHRHEYPSKKCEGTIRWGQKRARRK